MSVILECWSLGTSIGVVTQRLVKLILVSALYIGRIDVPVLSPEVFSMDSAPDSFKVDLLSHEAVCILIPSVFGPTNTEPLTYFVSKPASTSID